MNKLLLFPLLVIVLSCEEKEPIFTGKLNQFNELDFTYEKHKEDESFDQIQFDLSTTIPALDEWEEAIRIVRDGGWFNADYVCSIYQSNPIRIQLIGQRYLFHHPYESNPHWEFIYHEHILPQSSYDSIVSAIVELGIPQMNMDLNPENECSHCDAYSILIKNEAYKKLVSWIYFEFEEYEKLEKKLGLMLHQELLEMATYPKPRVNLKREKMKGDSVTYMCSFDDDVLVSRLQIIPLEEEKLFQMNRKDDKYIELIIHKTDTTEILEKVEFWGIQESGDTLILDKIGKL